MVATAEARLKLSAQDRTAGAFTAVSGRFSKVANQAKKFNRQATMMNNTAMRMQSSFLAMGKSAAAIFAPIAIGAGMKAAIVNAAQFERKLQRMVIKGEATDEQMAQIGQTIRKAADDARLPVETVMGGFDALLEAGQSVEEAMKLIGSTAIAAQAADASAADLSNTIIAVNENLGFTADQAQTAYDIMIKGGKAGKFELKDMAQFLPGLAPQFANLGFKGEEGLAKLVAMLQTVRTQTGSSGEAATALGDLFQKMEVDTVVNKFKKGFGVDVRKVMRAARRDGKDLVEVFLDLVETTTKGDLSLLPQLIPDKEMRRAVNALISQKDKFKEYTAEIKNAAGEGARDMARLADDTQSSIDRMSNAWDKFLGKLGQKVSPAAVAVLESATEVLDNPIPKRLNDNASIRAGLRGEFSQIHLTADEEAFVRAEHTKRSERLKGMRDQGDALGALGKVRLELMQREFVPLQRLVDHLDKITPGKLTPTPTVQKAIEGIPKARKPEEVPPMPKPGIRFGSLSLGGDLSRPMPVPMPKPGRNPLGATSKNIGREMEMDLTAAGEKAMNGFNQTLAAEGQKAVEAMRRTRGQMEEIIGAPFRSGPIIAPSGANANTGQSMPHIDAGT